MSLVAVVGDAATTTTLALAATWPDDPLVVEADPTGGSMSAWLDLPSEPTLSTVVTRVPTAGWPAVEQLTHHSPSGVRVIPAPIRSIEAVRAVAEADRSLFPLAAQLDQPVVLVDAGALVPAYGAPGVLEVADVAVVVHRQCRSSARAAAVRLDRFAELVDLVLGTGVPTVVAVVGDAPFETDEILGFVVAGAVDAPPRIVGGAARASSAPVGAVPPLVVLPDDPLTAAVLAGRSGVSPRRLARLPLMRAAGSAATTVAAVLAADRTVGGAGRWRADTPEPAP